MIDLKEFNTSAPFSMLSCPGMPSPEIADLAVTLIREEAQWIHGRSVRSALRPARGASLRAEVERRPQHAVLGDDRVDQRRGRDVECRIPHRARGRDGLAKLVAGTLLDGNRRAVRRFGSAALDLAWTAAGRYHGYWERGVKPWDVAAGLLLVREAGGVCLNFEGHEAAVDAGEVVAAAPGLARGMVERIRASIVA
jgi:hypothetical protein